MMKLFPNVIHEDISWIVLKMFCCFYVEHHAYNLHEIKILIEYKCHSLSIIFLHQNKKSTACKDEESATGMFPTKTPFCFPPSQPLGHTTRVAPASFWLLGWHLCYPAFSNIFSTDMSKPTSCVFLLLLSLLLYCYFLTMYVCIGLSIKMTFRLCINLHRIETP